MTNIAIIFLVLYINVNIFKNLKGQTNQVIEDRYAIEHSDRTYRRNVQIYIQQAMFTTSGCEKNLIKSTKMEADLSTSQN